MVKIVKNPGNLRLNNLNDPVLKVLIFKILHSCHRICLSFVPVPDKTTNTTTYTTLNNRLLLTEEASVYCKVRNGPLYKID